MWVPTRGHRSGLHTILKLKFRGNFKKLCRLNQIPVEGEGGVEARDRKEMPGKTTENSNNLSIKNQGKYRSTKGGFRATRRETSKREEKNGNLVWDTLWVVVVHAGGGLSQLQQV